MSITVTKYDMRGKPLAQTKVQTLQAAYNFLDALDDNGNTLVKPAPVAISLPADEPEAEEATVPG